jgi:hypothetical protein
MSDQSAAAKHAAHVVEPASGPMFEPYESPADGWVRCRLPRTCSANRVSR